MPLPLLFIGVAAATGSFGVGSTIKAGIDANKAKHINQSANDIVQNSTDWLNAQRLACGRSLQQLGEEKLYVKSSKYDCKIKLPKYDESDIVVDFGNIVCK